MATLRYVYVELKLGSGIAAFGYANVCSELH